MPNKEDEVGALWTRTTKNGDEFFTGTINGVKVVIFRNGYKRDDKHPDFRVYKAHYQTEGAP